MPYRYSDVDRHNLEWFERDVSRKTLLSMDLRKGKLRGLHDVSLRFRYPITAIAGRNGTGKTTALALAACAFHNHDTGHNPLKRKHPYYTFSDFFIQAAEEISPGGLEIWYEILQSQWTPSRTVPNGVGRAWQRSKKQPGGRWTDYAKRVRRDVVFFGIDRIVPHAERSVYRSYRSRFADQPVEGWEEETKARVSEVLGKSYSRLWFKSHGGYTLPMIQREGVVCSGFNLGAGENAVINMMSGILSCKQSLLLVIDEIELGLHEEAQYRLVHTLKDLCERKHIQVICTTHSATILGSLPPEGRLFIDNSGRTTTVVEGISSSYAAGRLAGAAKVELDVLVEDEVAASIVTHALNREERLRTRILPIGSAAAVVRHLAMRRKDPAAREALVILDGDMLSQRERFIDLFVKELEKHKNLEEEKNWFVTRLFFLPGDAWPERWVVSSLLGTELSKAANEFGLNADDLGVCLGEALLVEKHGEYAHVSQRLCLSIEYLRERLTYYAVEALPGSAETIRKCVREGLERGSA